MKVIHQRANTKQHRGISQVVIRVTLTVFATIFIVNVALLLDRIFIPAEWYLMHRMSNVDKNLCLQALRKMMREREDYLSVKNEYVAHRVGDAIQLVPLQNPKSSLPPEILALKPTQIMLWKDRAIVSPRLLHRSIAILAFDKGIEQYGSKKIINGLWYWDGRKKQNLGSGTKKQVSGKPESSAESARSDAD